MVDLAAMASRPAPTTVVVIATRQTRFLYARDLFGTVIAWRLLNLVDLFETEIAPAQPAYLWTVHKENAASFDRADFSGKPVGFFEEICAVDLRAWL